MENIQKISMDIMDNHIYEPIYTKQYDIGRQIEITITENGNSVDLTGITPIFQMKKPDGKVIIKNANISNNVIIVELDKNITVCYGNRVPFQIQLFNSNTNTAITTITGYMFIDESVVKLDDIESTSDFSTFTDILIQINDSSDKAKLYAENAKLSEENAKTSEENASSFATEAKSAKESAETSSGNAATSASNAAVSAENALQSENKAKISEDNALLSEQKAKMSEDNSKSSENNAKESEDNAKESEENALQSANQSKQYAIGESDSSKYYYEQAKSISESFAGALRPMGTVTFAALPSIDLASSGDMYNISDEFTTTDDFKEGSGFVEPAGSNIYKTSDGKWDVLAGTPVTGVKGDTETNYRRGNINITCEDIGALSLDGDSANNIVSYTSNDDTSVSSWNDVNKLESGESHKSIFSKISTMFKNIRFLYNTLGTTDISTIGDGTVSSAISTLNSNLGLQLSTQFESNYTSILAMVKAVPNDKNRVYSIKSTFTDYPPIMTAMGYTAHPVIKITSKDLVRYIELIACDANGRTKIIKGYTTAESSTIVWQEDDNICNALHLQATNTADSLSMFTVKIPDKYKNVSSLMYAISQVIGNWGTWSVCNTDISNGVIRIATNYTGSDIFSPWFSILLFY